MLLWLFHLGRSILFDEAAGQRYFAAVLYLVGSCLKSGGVLPGSDLVIPHLDGFTQYGPLCQGVAVFFGAGGSLPKIKPLNGGPAPAPRATIAAT